MLEIVVHEIRGKCPVINVYLEKGMLNNKEKIRIVKQIEVVI
jgi:hypothetical protein